MRLLESERYRGKQIRVYVIYFAGPSKTPALGVRVDGQVLEDEAFLQGTTELNEALDWGRHAVDRLLGPDYVPKPMVLPAPV